jgi:hypothetical protein
MKNHFSFALLMLFLLTVPACSHSKQLANHWGAVFTEMDKFPELSEQIVVGEELVREHRIRVRGWDYDKIIAEETKAQADTVDTDVSQTSDGENGAIYTISQETFNDRFDAVLYTTSIICKHMEMSEEETHAKLQPVFDTYLSEVEESIVEQKAVVTSVQERLTSANVELTNANLAFSELLNDLADSDSFEIDESFEESTEEKSAIQKAMKHAKARVEKAKAQVELIEVQFFAARDSLQTLKLQASGLKKTAEKLGLSVEAKLA